MPDLWGVFDYEVNMFRALSQLHQVAPPNPVIQNALVESRLLHIRILCDMLLSRGTDPNDINMEDLLPDFKSPKIEELKKVYGSNRTEGSLCWTLNKMLAHATQLRANSYNYGPVLAPALPIIESLLCEIEAERRRMSDEPAKTKLLR